MEIGLLGALQIGVGGRTVSFGSSKQRALVGLLALSPRRPIRTETLITGLWGDNAPASAIKTLQTYVAVVRKLLPEDVIRTVPGGYMLDVDPNDVDVGRFEDAVRSLGSLEKSGQLREARRMADYALALWRGDAVPDLTDSPSGQAAAVRLEEMRRGLEEDLADIRLRLGEHRVLASVLEEAVRSEPLRERRWAQLMIALYRSGRQPEALRAYQQFRTTLRDDLGLEPSSELSALEEAILLRKPELDWMPEPSIETPAFSEATGVTPVLTRASVQEDDEPRQAAPPATAPVLEGGPPNVVDPAEPSRQKRRARALSLTGVAVIVIAAAITTPFLLRAPRMHAKDLPRLPPYALNAPQIPQGPAQGALQPTQLTCSSPVWCIAAVGTGAGNPTTALWSWNGSRWSRMPGSKMTGSETFALYGLACSSRTQCFAVGACGCLTRGVPLILRWDGSSWTQLPLPQGTTPSAVLDAVQCPAPTLCFAVGADNSGALIDFWNGASWKPVPNPLEAVQAGGTPVGDLTYSALWSLSCATTTLCVSVGGFSDLQSGDELEKAIAKHDFAGITTLPATGRDEAAAEIWRAGFGWTATLLPFPAPAKPHTGQWHGFNAVACASVDACTAAGTTNAYVDGRTALVFDTWDGKSWSQGWRPGSLLPGGVPSFSCASGGCLAQINSYANSQPTGRDVILNVEETTGGSWGPLAPLEIPDTPQTAPATGGTSQQAFACASVSFCLSLGSFVRPRGCPAGETYAAEWDGASWSVTVLDVCSRQIDRTG